MVEPCAGPCRYELGAKDLLNNRLAYAAFSRAAYSAQLFTHDCDKLLIALGHGVSKNTHAPAVPVSEMEISTKQDQSYTFGMAYEDALQ